MGVEIEDAGRPCPECAGPMMFFTVTREYLDLPPATIIGCPDCGIGNPPATKAVNASGDL